MDWSSVIADPVLSGLPFKIELKEWGKIEIASPSNRLAELVEKRALYFEQGAKEVWICEETGEMIFYRADGRLTSSVMCPDFPQKVEF